MNDNDIIKALEDLIHKMKECCVTNWDFYASGDFVKNILDIINRLKRESNSYRNKAQAQKGELARLNKQVAEQKAEIERFKSELERADEALDFYVAEIERLQNAYKQCAWERDTFLEELKTAKSEAIKEFAERLKTKHHTWKTSDWILIKGVPLDYIDNLVKEMTEGKEWNLY